MGIGKIDNYKFYEGFEGEEEVEFSANDENMCIMGTCLFLQLSQVANEKNNQYMLMHTLKAE